MNKLDNKIPLMDSVFLTYPTHAVMNLYISNDASVVYLSRLTKSDIFISRIQVKSIMSP